MKISSVIAWSLVIMTAAAARADEDRHYWFNFPLRTSDEPLLVPASYSHSAFRNSMTAIEILSVKANGVDISPEIMAIAGGPDLHSVVIDRGTILHRFSRSFVESWLSIEPSDRQTNEVRRFNIPDAATVIEITYRVRSPENSKSGPFVATYIASDEKTHIFFIPRK